MPTGRQPQRWDVVVVGGAYTDYVARGPHLPAEGDNVQGDVFLELPGGKGLNQAVAAARLGARVAFVGCIGSDARGDALAASLSEEGVDTLHVLRSAEVHTGAALVHVNQHGHKQSLVAIGANAYLTAQDVAAAASALTATKTLLVQLEVPLGAVEAAVLLAAVAGARVVLDPAPFEEAGRLANAAAALATTVLGAYPSLPRRAAVNSLLRTGA